MMLGEVIRKWRAMAERGIRDVAKEIGTTPSTLSRIERGHNPDGETLAMILKWLLSKEDR